MTMCMYLLLAGKYSSPGRKKKNHCRPEQKNNPKQINLL